MHAPNSTRSMAEPHPAAPQSTKLGSHNQLAAVLWDMDGTLIDTEPLWIAEEHVLVSEFGRTWTHTQAKQLVGQALETSAGILQRAGVDLSKSAIIDRLMGSVIQRLENDGLPWRPGAQELLKQLRKDSIPCALVTMSHTPLANVIVANLPEGTFDVVVTGDQVSKGKPDPEAYLQALDQLQELHPGVTVNNSVAIEDSLPGTQSALAAGLTTIAVPLMAPLEPQPGQILTQSLTTVSVEQLQAVVANR